MSEASWWCIAAVAGLGLLAGAAAGQASGERPTTYVWLFSATGTEVENLADMVTKEFEEALGKTGCLPLVERRNYPDLESHQRQERRLAGADLSPREKKELSSTTKADAVIFGEITDDVQGGQIKVAITLEALTGAKLANTSVRFTRGKRFDAEERERRMSELASEVCGTLKVTQGGSETGHPSSVLRDPSPRANRERAEQAPTTESMNSLTIAERSVALVELGYSIYAYDIAQDPEKKIIHSILSELYMRLGLSMPDADLLNATRRMFADDYDSQCLQIGLDLGIATGVGLVIIAHKGTSFEKRGMQQMPDIAAKLRESLSSVGIRELVEGNDVKITAELFPLLNETSHSYYQRMTELRARIKGAYRRNYGAR